VPGLTRTRLRSRHHVASSPVTSGARVYARGVPGSRSRGEVGRRQPSVEAFAVTLIPPPRSSSRRAPCAPERSNACARTPPKVFRSSVSRRMLSRRSARDAPCSIAPGNSMRNLQAAPEWQGRGGLCRGTARVRSRILHPRVRPLRPGVRGDATTHSPPTIPLPLRPAVRARRATKVQGDRTLFRSAGGEGTKRDLTHASLHARWEN